jgi:hypothetical protein
MKSKLISAIQKEYEDRLIDELQESKIVKTSISVDRKDLNFVDSVAEHFDTTRTDIVAHVIHSAIDDFIQNLPQKSIEAVLEIAAKKDADWEGTRTSVLSGKSK